MSIFPENDIKFLKGIGERIGKLLATDMKIHTFRDLLYTFPTRYADRMHTWRIADFYAEMPHVQVKGQFLRFLTEGEGAKKRLIGLFSDGSANMEIVWFSRINQIANSLQPDKEYLLFGKPTLFKNTWSMVHPEVDMAEKAPELTGFHAIYSISDKARKHNITQRSIRRWIQNLLSHPDLQKIPETLPSFLISRLGLMPIADALKAIHLPSTPQQLQAARYRFKFEELYYIQLHILRFSRQRAKDIPGQKLPRVGELFNHFYHNILPFDLTNAQKKVVRQIRTDLISGKQMNRLLQGDVGSGKTLVAFLAALLAIDNGTQATIMAPTEILATQHYHSLHAWCTPLGINIGLLTGSTPASQRHYINNALLDGSMQLLIGTHALIEERVQYRNLAMAIIDEQHRFGVAQRAKLWGKHKIPPHMLVMTATPIPRTLAMTLYGDLDVSVIDQLPPGRKPIVTRLFYEDNMTPLWQLVAKKLTQGQQAYIVYPLIKENEKIDLRSLEEGTRAIQSIFGQHYKIATVHGQMKPAEKEHQMQLFSSGQAAILVATTVIEVGVNVPNATIMVIQSAERFGLSQLHQLRGRVGRGANSSICALVAKHDIGKESRRRLELMTATTDGFELAEADMRMRGPGDIEGTLQSGLPFNLRIASITTDADLMSLARQWATATLDQYPDLDLKQNPNHELQIITYELQHRFGRATNWSKIS